MATGTFTIHIPSIDYTGRLPESTCYTDANKSGFDRGTYSVDSSFEYVVDGSGLFTIKYLDSTGYTAWHVCSQNGYNLSVQFSKDGSTGWEDIATSFVDGWTDCYDLTLTVPRLEKELAQKLNPVVIPETGYIRLFTWTLRACPDSDFPNAYPNEAGAASEADPIYIVLDYTPMAVKHGDSWDSCNRTNGRLRARKDGAWGDTNLKTIDGGTGTTDPPSLRRNSTWYNQNKRGAE